MPKTGAQDLAERLVALEDQVKALTSGSRLQYTSIDDFAIPIKVDGEVRGRIGRQADGSTGVHVRKAAPPPMLSAPILTVGEQAGTCEVKWDGRTFYGAPLPVIHGHTAIWAELLADGQEPGVAPGESAVRVGTIRDRDGGEVLVALPRVGRWAVWLVGMAADRVTVGPWSPVSTVEITGRINEQAIRDELADARRERQEYVDAFDERTEEYDRQMLDRADAIAAADAWSASAMYRTDELAAESLETRVRADQAASDAIDAQQKYDQVSSRQDATEQEIQQARDDAAAAHQAAGQAEQYAAQTRDSVDGLRPFQSTLGPSGEGDEDQLWEQFDTMGHPRKLLGSWRWRDGVWNAITPSVTYLPMADISQATVADLTAQRIFAETGEVERLRVGANSGNLITDPGFEDFSQWLGGGTKTVTTGNNDQFQRVLRCTADLNTVRWVVQPGEQLYADFDLGIPDGTTMGRVSWRFETLAGGYHSFGPLGQDFGYSGWRRRRVEATAPNAGGPLLAHLTFRMSSGSNFLLANPVAGRITPGELTVEGILRATEGVIQRFFTDETVARIVWAEIVRAGLLEADEGLIGGVLLKEGAVTVDKLFALDVIMAELAKFLKIEVGLLESNEIYGMLIRAAQIVASTYLIEDANGNISVRLDGMDNFFAGRLHAGMNEQRGVAIDYGEVGVHTGWSDEDDMYTNIQFFDAPHLEFLTEHEHIISPKVWVNELGYLTLTPGVVNPGGGSPIPGTVRVHGRMQAHRFTASQIDVPTTSGIQPGGMRRDGPRTRLHGRTPSSSGTLDMYVAGRVGPYQVTNFYRTTIGWASPPAQGVRRPVASVSVAESGMDGVHHGSVTTAGHAVSSFRLMVIPSSNHNWNMWVDYIAPWH